MRLVVFVIDSSFGMSWEFEHLKSTYIDPLLKSLQDQDTIYGLVLYGHSARSRQPVENAILTMDFKIFSSKLSALVFKDGSVDENCLGDALASVLKEFLHLI